MNFSEGTVVWDQVRNILKENFPEVAVYALIDGAQLYHSGFFTRYGYERPRFISLLRDGAALDAVLAGPLLIQLDNDLNPGFVTSLLTLLREHNAVSFLSSSVPVSNLVRHLTYLTDVVHDDGTEWVMRYFDPRILPIWIGSLTEAQGQRVLSPVYRWIYMAVGGNAEILQGRSADVSLDHSVIYMTAPQCEHLMTCSLPYSILASVDDENPALFMGKPYTHRLAIINQLVRAGRAHGLHSFMDLKAYCIIAHDAMPGFEMIPEVHQALLDGVSGSFNEHTLLWDDHIWAKIAG